MMRKVVFSFLLLLGPWCSAQEFISSKNIFIRAYGNDGKKIEKGLLQSVTNDELRLYVKDSIIMIPVSAIGKLRTKRSIYGNILMGSIIGTTLGYTLIQGDSETSRSSTNTGGEVTAALVGGAIFGGGAGAVTSIFKKSKVYRINGDPSALEVFIEALKEQDFILMSQ